MRHPSDPRLFFRDPGQLQVGADASVSARLRPQSAALSAKAVPLPEPRVALAVVATPIALESRYRTLRTTLVRAGRSRKGRWCLGLGYGLLMVALALDRKSTRLN